METARLQFIPHTPGQLRALLSGGEDYARAVGFRIDSELVGFFSQASAEYISRLWSAMARDPWRDGFGILHKGTQVVVGLCGYVGPPDGKGVVEIAYAVATAHQGNGFATEAAGALVRHAFSHPAVVCVVGHTLPETNASSRVLEKCGFVRTGDTVDPDVGTVWRWELRRPSLV